VDHSEGRVVESMPVPAIDEEASRRRVASILLRLQRYVRGYLPNARIETDEDFSKNPAEVKIKVWWKDDNATCRLSSDKCY
jgi:hypothetical protein